MSKQACDCGRVEGVRRSRLENGLSSSCPSCKQLGRFCKHGHDTALYGRTKLGICKMCCKERQLKFTYGITLAEYEALFLFQKGKCAICGKPLQMFRVTTPVEKARGRAEVDHKHLTKKEKNKMKPYVPSKSLVRGLLCGGRWAGCNHKLGKVDNAEWLRSACAYVENPPAQKFFAQESEK